MAEKEERYISITQMVAKENIETEKYQVMPRQDAINRIAKAICMKEMFGCERCSYGKNKEKCEAWVAFTYMDNAEAALNSLLEDK